MWQGMLAAILHADSRGQHPLTSSAKKGSAAVYPSGHQLGVHPLSPRGCTASGYKTPQCPPRSKERKEDMGKMWGRGPSPELCKYSASWGTIALLPHCSLTSLTPPRVFHRPEKPAAPSPGVMVHACPLVLLHTDPGPEPVPSHCLGVAAPHPTHSPYTSPGA